MPSQPDDGSSDDHRRQPASPRRQLPENHFREPDRNVTVEDLRDKESARRTARKVGALSYGITAVILASIVLAVELDRVPVSESALSWVTIAGAATMMLVALGRYARTHSRQSDR